MVELKCSNCGAQLCVEPGAATVRCAFCGAEYLLERPVQNEEKAGARDVTGADGTPIVNVFVPQGWKAEAGVLGGNHSHQMPVVPMLALTCADGRIAFTGPRAYGDSSNGMVQDGQYDMRTVTEYCRYRSARQQAEQCAQDAARRCAFTEIHLLRENPLASGAQQELETQARQMQEANPRASVEASSGEFLYSFRVNGEEGCFLCASASVRLRRTLNAGTGMLGGMLGKLMGAVEPDLWFLLFDCTLVCSVGRFSAYAPLLEQTIASIRLTPQLQQAIAECQGRYAQAQFNTAGYAAQAAAQTSRNLSRIGAEEQQIIQQEHEAFSASQDRMAQQRYESTMGVNTYYGMEGRDVTASTRADHVYQNRQDSDVILGKEGAPLDGMPDWGELKQKP